MAKFLDFGKARALSFVNDYNRDIGVALQNDQLNFQAKRYREEKVNHYAKQLEEGVASTDYNTKRLESFYEDLNDQLANLSLKYGDRMEMDINAMREFNSITSQYLNNNILKEDQSAIAEFNKLKQAMQNRDLTDDEFLEQMDRFNAYADQGSDISKEDRVPPYVYVPPFKLDMNDVIGRASEQLGADLKAGKYGTVKEINRGELNAAAIASYQTDEKAWNTSWDRLKNKEVYGNNIYDYIEKSLLSRVSEGETGSTLNALSKYRASSSKRDVDLYNAYATQIGVHLKNGNSNAVKPSRKNIYFTPSNATERQRGKLSTGYDVFQLKNLSTGEKTMNPLNLSEMDVEIESSGGIIKNVDGEYFINVDAYIDEDTYNYYADRVEEGFKSLVTEMFKPETKIAEQEFKHETELSAYIAGKGRKRITYKASNVYVPMLNTPQSQLEYNMSFSSTKFDKRAKMKSGTYERSFWEGD